MGKLIRLTIQVDVEPENANLREAFEYLKRLKGAEQVHLVDIAVVKDPKAEEKKERRSLEESFGAEGEKPAPPPPPQKPPKPIRAINQEKKPDLIEEAEKLLDKVKIR